MTTWGEYLTLGIEQSPQFNSEMYPLGVNGDFYNVSKLPTQQVVDTFLERFENKESRDIAKGVPIIVDMLKNDANLIEGQKILDLGSGTGLFLSTFSNILGPEGSLVASEISASFLPHLQNRISEIASSNGFSNIQLVQSTNRDIGIANSDHTFDLVFICDVYHHFEYPKTIIRTVRRLLKPTGRLVVIDFHRDDDIHTSHPKGWILKHVRGDKQTFLSEILSCGFSLISEPVLPELHENYVLILSPQPNSSLKTVGDGWGELIMMMKK